MEIPQSPIIDEDTATFRYRDPEAMQVRFAADSTDLQPIPMQRDGEWWTVTRSYPPDARDEYLYVVGSDWVVDPLNPVRVPGGFGPRSSCSMPAYVQPLPLELPVDGRMKRQILAGRAVDVYVPAQPEGASTLFVQDGSDYIWFTGLPGLLDTLIRIGAVAPTLAVFLTPKKREIEYRANREYVDWMADRLLPAVAARYGTDPAPERHGLMGASLGGLIATYGALRRPDAFLRVGAQSPAYRLTDGTDVSLDALLHGEWEDLRCHLDGGTFEMRLHRREYLPSIRRGAELLRQHGSAVQYNEVNEGHNWMNWRGRLPALLTWLLAPPS